MKRSLLLKAAYLDVFFVLFLIMCLGNVLYTANRNLASINLIPMWILLAAICLVAHRARRHPFLVLLLVLLSLSGLEFWRAGGVTVKAVLLTAFVYTPCMLFFVLMGSVAADNRMEKKKDLEKELAGLRRTVRSLEEALRGKGEGREEGKEKEKEVGGGAPPTADAREKLEQYRFNARILPRLTNVAHASDLPAVFEKLFAEELGILQGMVVMQNPETGTLQAVSHWGIPEDEALLRRHLDSPLAGWVFSKGHMILEKEILTHPQLSESKQAFFAELFPLSCMLPIRQGQMVVLAIFVGQQRSTATLRFRESLVAPLLQILESILAG